MKTQATDAVDSVFAEGVVGKRSSNSDMFQKAASLIYAVEEFPCVTGSYIYFCSPLVGWIRIRYSPKYFRVFKAEFV